MIGPVSQERVIDFVNGITDNGPENVLFVVNNSKDEGVNYFLNKN